MAWLYLIIAALFEIGWPVGLKIATQENTRVLGIIIAIVFMIASGVFLWLAQRTIPIGTAYAIWTGIGATGTFLIGVMFYQDALTFWRAFGVLMIISGVIILKLTSH